MWVWAMKNFIFTSTSGYRKCANPTENILHDFVRLNKCNPSDAILQVQPENQSCSSGCCLRHLCHSMLRFRNKQFAVTFIENAMWLEKELHMVIGLVREPRQFSGCVWVSFGNQLANNNIFLQKSLFPALEPFQLICI